MDPETTIAAFCYLEGKRAWNNLREAFPELDFLLDNIGPESVEWMAARRGPWIDPAATNAELARILDSHSCDDRLGVDSMTLSELAVAPSGQSTTPGIVTDILLRVPGLGG